MPMERIYSDSERKSILTVFLESVRPVATSVELITDFADSVPTIQIPAPIALACRFRTNPARCDAMRLGLSLGGERYACASRDRPRVERHFAIVP